MAACAQPCIRLRMQSPPLRPQGTTWLKMCSLAVTPPRAWPSTALARPATIRCQASGPRRAESTAPAPWPLFLGAAPGGVHRAGALAAFNPVGTTTWPHWKRNRWARGPANPRARSRPTQSINGRMPATRAAPLGSRAQAAALLNPEPIRPRRARRARGRPSRPSGPEREAPSGAKPP